MHANQWTANDPIEVNGYGQDKGEGTHVTGLIRVALDRECGAVLYKGPIRGMKIPG